MSPDETFVMAVNRALADPDVRATIGQMHAEGYPLVKMVEALGLEDDMPTRIREVLEGLPSGVVEGIRAATLQMLKGPVFAMPLSCKITNKDLESGVLVDVNVKSEPEGLTIHVGPKA
jgi:hypothetical protein